MEISRIYIKGGTKKEYISKATLKEGLGIIDNKKPKNKDREIAIFSQEGRFAIENLETHGLCSKRFHENITIKDLHIQDIQVGSILKIGESILEITEVGKRCFPECNLFQDQSPCPLTQGVIYGRVQKGGSIQVGDQVIQQ